MSRLTVGLAPAGDRLVVGLANGGTVEVGVENAGRLLQHLLMAQGSGEWNVGVGTQASPTQQMVEEWLRKGGKVRRVDERGKEVREELRLEDLLREGEEDL